MPDLGLPSSQVTASLIYTATEEVAVITANLQMRHPKDKELKELVPVPVISKWSSEE